MTHLSRKTLRLGRFLRRWSKRRSSLSPASSHYTSKMIARSMANLWRRRLVMAWPAQVMSTTSGLEFAPQGIYLILIGFLHLNLSLFEIPQLAANIVHLLDLI